MCSGDIAVAGGWFSLVNAVEVRLCTDLAQDLGKILADKLEFLSAGSALLGYYAVISAVSINFTPPLYSIVIDLNSCPSFLLFVNSFSYHVSSSSVSRSLQIDLGNI